MSLSGYRGTHNTRARNFGRHAMSTAVALLPPHTVLSNPTKLHLFCRMYAEL